MKILISILSALTLTTMITISAMPLSLTKTVKKHKIKHHREEENDNENNEEDTISLQEEKKQIKYAKQIVEFLEDQNFDFTDNNSIKADGKKTWKQVFSVLERNISELFKFEDNDELTNLNLELLSFNFTFVSENDIELTENSIIVNNNEFIALEISILPKWKKQWIKKQKIKAKINLKVGGKTQQEVNNVISKNIANDVVKNDVFKKGYIASIYQGLNNGVTSKNQDLINEIEKLLKTDLRVKYQEEWNLDIKNENENEQSQADLIAGDKIFTISITVGKNEQQATFKIKKPLYVSVKIENTKDKDFLLEQTAKYLIKQIDDAILLPNQKLEDIMWYQNFANQLIDIYKENHYSIDSINILDVQNGSYPDLLKTFKSIVQKDQAVLTDFTNIINWISESRFFEKIALKFKTLKEQFATSKIQIKFIQKIAEQTYDFTDNTAMQSIYTNDDKSFLTQNSKISVEIWIDEVKKITLETKTSAFDQFTLINNYLAAFLATAIETILNSNSNGNIL